MAIYTSKFKPGDKVKVLRSIYDSFDEIANMIGKVCVVKERLPMGEKYAVWQQDEKDWWTFYEDELELAVPSLDHLQVGDIIRSQGGGLRRVLEVGASGNTCLLSLFTYTKNASDFYITDKWYTVSEIKYNGWEVVVPGANEGRRTELALLEVAEKFGISVDELRIKDKE